MTAVKNILPMRENKQKQPFAKKSFGQNFLVDQNYIDKIIRALAPQAGETIVEIGAGRGALTERLIKSGANVVAVELEREMIGVLKERFGAAENFRLIESDALKVDFSSLISHPSSLKIKLVANLPYYISTAILQNLIAQREMFSEMILMFQREVVTRITARAETAERGFLTVLTEAFLNTEKLFDVPPSAFRPQPKVWSAIVKLTAKKEKFFVREKLFESLISQAFRQKRKTLWNNLKQFQPDKTTAAIKWQEVFAHAGISPDSRAESLALDDWRKLCDAIYPNQ